MQPYRLAPILHALSEGLSSVLLWLKPDMSLHWHSVNLAEVFPGVTVERGAGLAALAASLGDPTLAKDVRHAVQESRTLTVETWPRQDQSCTRRIVPCGREGGVIVLYGSPPPEQARRETLLQGQVAVLTLTAEGTPYTEVLDYLLCFIEAQYGIASKGAICVFDPEGVRLNHVAAPSLPDKCRQAMVNLSLGPEFGIYGDDHGGSDNGHIAVFPDIGAAPGWESFRASAARYHLNACWTAPMVTAAGAVLGLLVIFVDEGRPPDRWERTLIETAARTAAIAIEYSRQEEQATTRLRQQEAVARLGCYALQGHHLTAVLERAVKEAADTLEVPFCAMLELQRDGRSLLMRAGCGWPPEMIDRAALSVTESQAGYTLQTKAPVIVTDLRSEPRFQVSSLLTEAGAVSGACVMILGEHGHNYGVLGVHSRERRDFSGQDVHFIQAVANIIAATLSRHRSEQELLQSREQIQRQYAQLTAIYDTAPVGLCLFDTALRLQNLNGRLAQLLGAPLETAVGHRLQELLPPVAETLESACRQVIVDGRPLTHQEVCWRPDATSIAHDHVWLCSYYPIKSTGGAVLGINTVIQDITERHLAHEERSRLANLVASSHDAIIGKTLKGVITSWNQGAEQLYGYRADEAIGRSIDIIIPPEHRQEFARIREVWHKGQHVDLHETQRLHRDGRRLYVSLTISPIRDLAGRIVGASTIERDISERKEADLVLRMSEATLRRQAEELATADRQKDDFIAMLGHELRNPLSPIANASQLLQIENERLASQPLSNAISIIDRQVKQMTRLVDDLLDVARITRGRIELRRAPVDVREAVNHALETLQPALSAKGQELALSLPRKPLRVDGDAVRLTQALCNVLSNASKYSPAGGRIEIGVERREARASIRVRDYGEGIAPELLPKVFDLFTQADRSLSRPQGGLGLGLTLVKRLVEMHGGAVVITSEGAGKGAEVMIELPLLPKGKEGFIAADMYHPSPHAAHDLRRVLIVDDNVDSAEALGTLLKLRGYTVSIAYDGGSALATASRQPPHVVFLDIGLPDMTGYDVAARLRRLDGGSGGMRLVALTGYGLGHRGGQDPSIFDHYMLKPIAMEKLKSVLEAG